MRRFLVCLVIASVLAASGGCSQPVDTGSPVPAQEQPIVALLALAGLAIGVVAFIHHEHAKASPGPSPSPGITGPKLFIQLSSAGSDMNIADVGSAVIIGVLQSVSPSDKYQQATIPSGGSPQMASCVLPSTYMPTAVAIDATGAIWFDDDAGNVKRFAPVSTNGGACSQTFSTTDGFGVSGTRSMDADASNVYLAIDNGTGKVSFAQISITSGTGPSGSITASDLLDPKDAITATSFLNGGIASFTGFRVNGGSFVVQNGTAAANSFVLNPVPNGNPTVSEDPSSNELFYGLIGSPSSGLYQIVKYNSGGSQMSAISIASDGVTADSRFAVPLSSLRADHNRNTYALDANGNLVEFTGF